MVLSRRQMQANNNIARLAIGGLLAAMVWLVFGQTSNGGFVNFDDATYVFKNPVVKKGCSADGIRWAFTHSHGGNWHPLTTLTHMLDCQFYGLAAGGHHLTNVLIHTATAILLFFILRSMTGALWPSALVAAIFAIHPLRVESVAWISERKDVLSGLLFMLTLGAYERYAREPGRASRYLLVLGLFGLGLMAKPMLVTVPFVLLLLDYWPLQRFKESTESWLGIPRRLILEKIPLLAMSALVCGVTMLVQQPSIQPAGALSPAWRLGNVLNSYLIYLGQLFYPAWLAAYYPHDNPATGWPAAKIILSLALLTVISAMVYRERARRPYLLTGWLWYAGMLIPVIGLVQVGTQAHADRYTYLPHIGLLLMLIWGGAEWSAGHWQRRVMLGVGAMTGLVALILCAREQTTCWQDSQKLWSQTLNHTTENAYAENMLGCLFLDAGQLNLAEYHLRKAIEIEPADGSYSAPYFNNLGLAVFRSGQTDQAVGLFRQSLTADPEYAPANNNYGIILLQSEKVFEAIKHFQTAVKSDPELADAQNNLGNALIIAGRPTEALVHYEKAIALEPDAYPSAYLNLAWVMATSTQANLRDGPKALAMARRAYELSPGNAMQTLRTLAAAEAESGRFSQALNIISQALRTAGEQADLNWVNVLQKERQLYLTNQPLRYPAPTP